MAACHTCNCAGRSAACAMLMRAWHKECGKCVGTAKQSWTELVACKSKPPFYAGLLHLWLTKCEVWLCPFFPIHVMQECRYSMRTHPVHATPVHATHVFAFAMTSHYIQHKPVQDFNIWCVYIFLLLVVFSRFHWWCTATRTKACHYTEQVSNVRTCVSEIADMHACKLKVARKANNVVFFSSFYVLATMHVCPN